MGMANTTLYTLGLGDVGTANKDIYLGMGMTDAHPLHSHLWGRGDVGTANKDIYLGMGMKYTYPIYSRSWGHGDVGTAP